MQIPRPEHPTPLMQRAQWLNLNGPWRFAFDPHTIGEQERWYSPHSSSAKSLTITVPFPWESPASGVERPDYKGAGWYEREFTVPAEWQGLTPYLNFGAVDWQARVWVNGQLAGEHENGYLPFSIDLSRFVQPGQSATVTVRAYDVADASTLVGKQVPRWYTHSSGIWQTVWLEGRAPSHIRAIRIEPNVAAQEATVKLNVYAAAAGEYTVSVRARNGDFPDVTVQRTLRNGEQPVHFSLSIPDPQLWSPESPHLYEVDIDLSPASGDAADSVQSYFGMRTIRRSGWNGNEYEYILLNGEPVYLRGALDQAFHPDGLHAYPSDDVIRGDIQLAKDVGLNMLRCHIKINDPRYYYWADKLGLLIMYDIPSPDLDTPTMRRIVEETLPQVISRDFNSPSIMAWIIFNETWGLTEHHTAEGHRWLKSVVEKARKLDPTRLIEDNSVCKFDHVETDINSWHYYINDYHRVRQHIQRVVDETYPGSPFNYVGGDYVQKTAPLMNSEYGGISAAMGDQDIAWCFKYQTTELRKHAKICGYVYTELDDIEWEHNGFVNYDRSRKIYGYDFFVDGMSLVDLNSPDLVGLDAPPCQTVAPGSEFSAPLFVSHWGPAMSTAQVHWTLDLTDRFGQKQQVSQGVIPVHPQRFGVINVGALSVTLPEQAGLATLALRLEDDAGQIRCRNYVNLELRTDAAPAAEKLANGWALRIAPGHYQHTSWQWPMPFSAPDGAKFSAHGNGYVDYEVMIPTEVDATQISRIRLLAEMGARGGMAKVDWRQQTRGFNYPQTEEDKQFPTNVVVELNNVVIGEIHIADDPADARGVLSHHSGIDPGSYGYLTELVIDGNVLETLKRELAQAPALRVRFAVPGVADHAGGLSLYGETVGCYPLGPTLILEM